MGKIIDYIFNSVYDPKIGIKYPVWFHYVLRSLLQLFLGYGTYITWKNEYYITSALFALFFVYAIVVLIFGQQIRNLVIEMI